MRYSEWILNHVVRKDFLVELDNRVMKTCPCESHTGNPAPRPTSFRNRILVGRRDDDDKQPRSRQAWFLRLIAGSNEVISLDPDGVQRHHGDCRVSPLDDRESNTRELKSAPALMTECDWRTPGCKTCQDVRYHEGWHSTTVEHRPRGNKVSVMKTDVRLWDFQTFSWLCQQSVPGSRGAMRMDRPAPLQISWHGKVGQKVQTSSLIQLYRLVFGCSA